MAIELRLQTEEAYLLAPPKPLTDAPPPTPGESRDKNTIYLMGLGVCESLPYALHIHPMRALEGYAVHAEIVNLTEHAPKAGRF